MPTTPSICGAIGQDRQTLGQEAPPLPYEHLLFPFPLYFSLLYGTF